MGIGTYSIIGILKDYKNKSYDLLIENIKNAVEEHYIECKHDGGSSSIGCNKEFISLGDLVQYGYLESNSDNDILINPKTEESIKDCEVQGKYENGVFTLTKKTGSSSVCPDF